MSKNAVGSLVILTEFVKLNQTAVHGKCFFFKDLAIIGANLFNHYPPLSSNETDLQETVTIFCLFKNPQFHFSDHFMF